MSSTSIPNTTGRPKRSRVNFMQQVNEQALRVAEVEPSTMASLLQKNPVGMKVEGYVIGSRIPKKGNEKFKNRIYTIMITTNFANRSFSSELESRMEEDGSMTIPVREKRKMTAEKLAEEKKKGTRRENVEWNSTSNRVRLFQNMVISVSVPINIGTQEAKRKSYVTIQGLLPIHFSKIKIANAPIRLSASITAGIVVPTQAPATTMSASEVLAATPTSSTMIQNGLNNDIGGAVTTAALQMTHNVKGGGGGGGGGDEIRVQWQASLVTEMSQTEKSKLENLFEIDHLQSMRWANIRADSGNIATIVGEDGKATKSYSAEVELTFNQVPIIAFPDLQWHANEYFEDRKFGIQPVQAVRNRSGTKIISDARITTPKFFDTIKKDNIELIVKTLAFQLQFIQFEFPKLTVREEQMIAICQEFDKSKYPECAIPQKEFIDFLVVHRIVDDREDAVHFIVELFKNQLLLRGPVLETSKLLAITAAVATTNTTTTIIPLTPGSNIVSTTVASVGAPMISGNIVVANTTTAAAATTAVAATSNNSNAPAGPTSDQVNQFVETYIFPSRVQVLKNLKEMSESQSFTTQRIGLDVIVDKEVLDSIGIIWGPAWEQLGRIIVPKTPMLFHCWVVPDDSILRSINYDTSPADQRALDVGYKIRSSKGEEGIIDIDNAEGIVRAAYPITFECAAALHDRYRKERGELKIDPATHTLNTRKGTTVVNVSESSIVDLRKDLNQYMKGAANDCQFFLLCNVEKDEKTEAMIFEMGSRAETIISNNVLHDTTDEKFQRFDLRASSNNFYAHIFVMSRDTYNRTLQNIARKDEEKRRRLESEMHVKEQISIDVAAAEAALEKAVAEEHAAKLATAEASLAKAVAEEHAAKLAASTTATTTNHVTNSTNMGENIVPPVQKRSIDDIKSEPESNKSRKFEIVTEDDNSE